MYFFWEKGKKKLIFFLKKETNSKKKSGLKSYFFPEVWIFISPPTKYLTILDPQNPSNDEFCLVEWNVYEALKLFDQPDQSFRNDEPKNASIEFFYLVWTGWSKDYEAQNCKRIGREAVFFYTFPQPRWSDGLVLCQTGYRAISSMGRLHAFHSSFLIDEAASWSPRLFYLLPSNNRFFSAWAVLSKNRLEHIFKNTSFKSAVWWLVQ